MKETFVQECVDLQGEILTARASLQHMLQVMTKPLERNKDVVAAFRDEINGRGASNLEDSLDI